MGSTEKRAEHPAMSDEMTAALNQALEAGDLDRIMGTLGEMTRAHRMRRVTRETGLGEKSLYKSMRAGASPEFNTVLRVLQALGFRLQVHATNANCEQDARSPARTDGARQSRSGSSCRRQSPTTQ